MTYTISESKTLTELLKINQYQLALTLFPDVNKTLLNQIFTAAQLGILKKMQTIGDILYSHYGFKKSMALCHNHTSDIVRGWACFIIANHNQLTIAKRLSYLLPFADDPHFGVREWAWLALRPYLIHHLNENLLMLAPLTQSSSEYIRRFACEILRPRGVWCQHITELKQDPSPGLIILKPLKNDSSIYVQNSVSNWLNDACKTRPDWVKDVCSQWLNNSKTNATKRICKRALRSLKE